MEFGARLGVAAGSVWCPSCPHRAGAGDASGASELLNFQLQIWDGAAGPCPSLWERIEGQTPVPSEGTHSSLGPSQAQVLWESLWELLWE